MKTNEEFFNQVIDIIEQIQGKQNARAIKGDLIHNSDYTRRTVRRLVRVARKLNALELRVEHEEQKHKHAEQNAPEMQQQVATPASDVGFQNFTYSSDLLIFPNPFNAYCMIFLPDGSAPSFTLFDAEGKKIEHQIEFKDSHYVLNRNNLTPGTYTLSINFDNRVVSKKLTIVN